jgi:hypothetical protein
VVTRVHGVSAWLCGSIDLFYLDMLVREPVHGMQGLLERQIYESFPKPEEVNSPLGGVGLFSFAVHLRWVGVKQDFVLPFENLGVRPSPKVKHFEGLPAPSVYECACASVGRLSPQVGEPVASVYECEARMQAIPEMY